MASLFGDGMLDSLFEAQDEAMETASRELMEDTELFREQSETLSDINAQLLGLDTEAQEAQARLVNTRADAVGEVGRLYRAIDQREREPFTRIRERVGAILDPDNTIAGWMRQIEEQERRDKLATVRYQQSVVDIETRRLSLKNALKDMETRYNLELKETELAEGQLSLARGKIAARSQRMQALAQEWTTQELTLLNMSPSDITPEFLAENDIPPEMAQRVFRKKHTADMTYERNLMQINREQMADAIARIDFSGMSQEEAVAFAQEQGIPEGLATAEWAKDKRQRDLVEVAELQLAAGKKEAINSLRREFLRNASPMELERALAVVDADPTSNIISMGPFSVTEEELIGALATNREHQAGETTREVNFLHSQGLAKDSIDVLSRAVGSAATPGVDNAAATDALLKNPEFPDMYRPVVQEYTNFVKKFQSMSPLEQELHKERMMKLNAAFVTAVNAFVDAEIATYPEHVQNGAQEYYTKGKIRNAASQMNVLGNSMSKLEGTGNKIGDNILRGLFSTARDLKLNLPEAEKLDMTAGEKTMAQLGAVLADGQMKVTLADMGINMAAIDAHKALAQKYGLDRLATDIDSLDPKNVLKGEDGNISESTLFGFLGVYLNEASADVTMAQYEAEYVQLVESMMLDGMTPLGNGAVTTAALSGAIFGEQPGVYIRDLVQRRLMLFSNQDAAKKAEAAAKERRLNYQTRQGMQRVPVSTPPKTRDGDVLWPDEYRALQDIVQMYPYLDEPVDIQAMP